MIRVPLYTLKKLFMANSLTIAIAFLCVKNPNEKMYLVDITKRLNINSSQLTKGLDYIDSWFFWDSGKDNRKKNSKYIKFNGKIKYTNNRTKNVEEVEISDKVINFTMNNYHDIDKRNAIKMHLGKMYFKHKYKINNDEMLSDLTIEFLGWENRTSLVNKYIEIIKDNLVEEV